MSDQSKFRWNFKTALFAVITVSVIATAGFNPDLLTQSGYIPNIALFGVELIDTCWNWDVYICEH